METTLSVLEVAKKMNVAPATVTGLLKRGKLRATLETKQVKVYRIDPASIPDAIDYLKNRTGSGRKPLWASKKKRQKA